MKANGLTLEWTLRSNGRRQVQGGLAGVVKSTDWPGKIPRVTRLMALAIKFEGMVVRGEVRDFADLARLGYVTRARMTQVMNLLNLAPDIQEEILFLPNVASGRDRVTERSTRVVATVVAWNRQRRLWRSLRK